MKKIISLAIIFCMLFTATASAFTVFKHTYTDVDGTVYHIGTFEEDDTDAGVIVNGKKYSLKSGIYMGDAANAWEEASGKQRRFALGLRTPAGFEGDSYSVAPYSVDAEGKIKVGQAFTVSKKAIPELAYEKTVSGVVVDDVKNGFNNDENVSTNSITQLTIKCDGKAKDVSNHNMVMLAKVDISELKKDYVEGTDVYFTLKGGYTGSWATSAELPNTLSEITVHVAGAEDVSQEWTEENAPAFKKENGDAKSYYHELAMSTVPLDSAVVSTADSNKGVMSEYKFNITGFVQQQLAKGNDYANLAVWVDNADAEKDYIEKGARNAYLFKILSRENADNGYKLIYTAEDVNINLKSLKVDGEDIAPYLENKAYTKYVSSGAAIPAVTAEAESAAAKVEVTQADSVNGKATVKITSGNGKESEEYTVWMVESPFASEKATLGLYDNKDMLLGSIHNPRTNDKNAATANQAADGKLELFASAGDSRFVHSAVIIKLDLEELAGSLDLSSEITLTLNKHKFAYDVTGDTPKNTTAELALYDATGLVDWSTAVGGNYCQQIVPALEDKKPIENKTLPTNLGAVSTEPVSYDISEFVRKAVREGNLTPTLAFVLDHSFDPSGTNRIQMDFYLATNATEQMTISCNKYPEGMSVSDASAESITIGKEEVNPGYIANGVYTYYMPFAATEVPEVKVTSSPAAKVEVTQATTLSDTAKVKITSYDKNNVNEFEVKFVVSELPSGEAFTALGWNSGAVANGNKNILSVGEQTSSNMLYTFIDSLVRYQSGVKVADDKETPVYTTFINSGKQFGLYNSPVAKGGYVPSVSLMQLDLEKLINTKKLDLSQPIELHIDGTAKTYDTSAAPDITSLELVLYEADHTDWAGLSAKVDSIIAEKDNLAAYNCKAPTDEETALINRVSATAEEVRSYLRNLNNFTGGKEILTMDVPYGNYGLTATDTAVTNKYGNVKAQDQNDFLKVDISEFVRYCVANGNLKPTIAFYIKPCDAKVMNRQIFTMNYSGTGNMSYIRYSAKEELDEETLKAYSDTSLHSLSVNGEEVNVSYINPADNTYTAYLPYGTDMAPWVDATVNELSKVEIESAVSTDEDTVITVTAFDGSSATYKVKSVVSEYGTQIEKYPSIGWNQGIVANGNKNIIAAVESTGSPMGSTYDDITKYQSSEKVNASTGATTPVYTYFLKTASTQLYNTSVTKGGYAPSVMLMQLDLNTLVKGGIDLSMPVELHLDGTAKTYELNADKTPKFGDITSLNLSLYDMTESSDWKTINETIAKIMGQQSVLDQYNFKEPDATLLDDSKKYTNELMAYLRDLDSRFNNSYKITTKEIPYGSYGLLQSGTAEKNVYGNTRPQDQFDFVKIDISEFVRYCISTGNMNPTIGFYIEPNSAPEINRQLFSINYSTTGNMSYLHYTQNVVGAN